MAILVPDGSAQELEAVSIAARTEAVLVDYADRYKQGELDGQSRIEHEFPEKLALQSKNFGIRNPVVVGACRASLKILEAGGRYRHYGPLEFVGLHLLPWLEAEFGPVEVLGAMIAAYPQESEKTRQFIAWRVGDKLGMLTKESVTAILEEIPKLDNQAFIIDLYLDDPQAGLKFYSLFYSASDFISSEQRAAWRYLIDHGQTYYRLSSGENMYFNSPEENEATEDLLHLCAESNEWGLRLFGLGISRHADWIPEDLLIRLATDDSVPYVQEFQARIEREREEVK